MKAILTLVAIFTTATLGWSEPQQPAQNQVAQQTAVQTLQSAQTEPAKLVKAPAPKAEKKPAEIQFRDFLTARDAYPTR